MSRFILAVITFSVEWSPQNFEYYSVLLILPNTVIYSLTMCASV